MDTLADMPVFFDEALAWVDTTECQSDTIIAELPDSVYKQRLAALQEEIKAKSADRALTEYDIQMMNLEYELLQRQMALEEAKNAKDTVRLTRDSSGNYVYQYTADQDKIAEAQ